MSGINFNLAGCKLGRQQTCKRIPPFYTLGQHPRRVCRQACGGYKWVEEKLLLRLLRMHVLLDHISICPSQRFAAFAARVTFEADRSLLDVDLNINGGIL